MEITGLFVVIALLAVAARAYQVERDRATRALRLARGLERVARDLTAETDPLTVLRSIPGSALALFPATYAVLVVRKGDHFEIAAGAGLGTQVVGMRRHADEGVFGDVLRTRATVSVADYREHPRAVVAARDLGIRSVVATPIFVRGELAACLVVARTQVAPFDGEERGAAEGLAAHASIALANARTVELARRLERIARTLAAETAEDRVYDVIAREAAEAFNTDFVLVIGLEAAGTHMLGGIGGTAAIVGRRYDRPGPLTKEVAERRETIYVRDYFGTFPITAEDEPVHVDSTGQRGSAGLIARDVGIHAVVAAPIITGDDVSAVFVVGTAEPTRTFDELERQGITRLAETAGSALATIRQVVRLRELYLATVKALAAAVDARDPYTRSHSARVSALARLIAEEMLLSADEVRRVQLGALLHDIGKIGIPDAILNKPAALSGDEWVIMRTHPSVGASILESVEPLADLVPIVRDHHERYDGQGYPAALQGGAVDVTAYIVAVADAYEVIVSKRSYKEARPVEFAVAELQRCRGTQFHPGVVDAFLRVIERDAADGSRVLARVGAIEQEEIEDVPGPGDVVQRYAAGSATYGRRLAVLQRLASEFGAVLDLDELTGRLLRIICDSMGSEYGFLTTVDRDTSEQVVRAAFGPSGTYVGSRLPRGRGISAWVLEHGRLQNVGDVTADPRFYGPPDVRSNLIVPLRIDDEVVGVIGIESTRPHAFTTDDEQLLTAVSHQIAAAVRVASLHRLAKHAAATDPLTGLANRRAFFERLDAALVSCAADGPALTVAIADVDGLKQLNDGHGHHAGDEGLIRVAEMLSEGVRNGDLAARIGGDEFAVLFVGAPILVADRAMRRVADRLASAPLASGLPAPTISWGLAQATGPATSDQLVEIADSAMYRHKRRARTRVG